MWRLIACAVAFAAVLIGPLRAEARTVVSVDKSTQRMSVSVDGVTRYVWDVSTGRENFGTPNGIFNPERLAPVWFSRKYYNSPINDGWFWCAVHKKLGTYRASDINQIELRPINALLQRWP